MKKLLSLLALVLLLPLGLRAQDANGSILITRPDGGKISVPRSNVQKITFDYIEVEGLVAIDLGLSVDWACVNLDVAQESKVVSAPEVFGGYQGWADPTGLKTANDVNQYPSSVRPANICGTEYDIATQQLGEGWRLPTTAEFEELLKLKWERTTLNDVPGIRFTADNGNSIFLPYAGYRYRENCFQQGQYGYYWTGDRHATNQNFAADLNIGPDICRVANQNIYNGCSVRAVKVKN